MTMFTYGPLVDGAWRESAEEFTTRNPARPAETVGRYGLPAEDVIRDAIAAGRRAQRVFAQLPALERMATIGRFLSAIEERGETIARAITLEQGKILSEARGETVKALAESRIMLARAFESEGAAMPSSRPGFRNMTLHRPRGLIVAVTPWNFPILTPMRKVAPALTFGNAIIVKPSEFAPAAVCLIGDAALATLPPGLLQILPGDGRVAAALCGASGVDGVTFTGSVATGRKVYAAAAAQLAEVSLELGGKNAAVVHDAEDLEHVLDQIAGAAFQCSGQRCTAISRVIVRDTLHDAVVEGLVKRADALCLGDGLEPGVTMGPLTNAAQLARVEEMLAQGVKDGARRLGRSLDEAPANDGGYFHRPVILEGVSSEMHVARDEIFGPVISVINYRELDDAFRILNDVEFGLTSSLFSNDHRVVQRFIAEAESGMLHVNHGTIPENHMPFGGVKNSGVGAYSVGPSARAFYATEHSVYLKM